MGVGGEVGWRMITKMMNMMAGKTTMKMTPGGREQTRTKKGISMTTGAHMKTKFKSTWELGGEVCFSFRYNCFLEQNAIG